MLYVNGLKNMKMIEKLNTPRLIETVAQFQ